MSQITYATQLLKIIKTSKRAMSYESAAKSLKKANPQLEDTAKNTLCIKKMLERFVEKSLMKKTPAGNYTCK
ncbi:hypothetical protein [Bacillus sp. FJAT-45350]|uniref:hypothetical protein n=1 Tax=Bacillus sp. FJAT-45350 TaxID=2011014 RepID=UPI000BB91FAF|nr:hypothetical protein [Bacillus sp. FJAT-45350]